MSRRELDAVFRKAAVASPPTGALRGTLILPGAPFAYITAALVSALVWRGKIFTRTGGDEGTLLNQVGPFASPAVAGKFYIGESWLDGRPAIVIDYSQTSFLARRIRDEIREVHPGLYLGKVWWRRTRLFDFALVR